MTLPHHHRARGKRLPKTARPQSRPGIRLAALLLCLAVLAGALPTLAFAEGEGTGGARLSDAVRFGDITLHYADANGMPDGQPIQTGQDKKTLLEKDRHLVLYYTYEITGEQCSTIQANTPYYLDVSPHLVLTANLAAPLISGGDDGVRFGTLYTSANGDRAWVEFSLKGDGSGTVLSDFAGLQNAFFYLGCQRAGSPPGDAAEDETKNNLYTMKFETNPVSSLHFGYAENEPLNAKAVIAKGGSLADRTITWTIDYTPWQNPVESDGVTLDAPFELRDTIDTSVHSYVEGSVKIDGQAVTTTSRDENAGAYVLVDSTSESGKTLLTFGGTKFKAGTAKQGETVAPLKITYQTEINAALLLPGGTGGKNVTNKAELFAGPEPGDGPIMSSNEAAVTVNQPTWMTKTGETHRHTDGTGSTTDWTVTFNPNGFDFTGDNSLTLHDQLPDGSTLVGDSVKITVNGNEETKTVTKNEEENSFTVSGIETANQPVTIEYQTSVPEEMYDSGTGLGENTAWFTLHYGEKDYTTPPVKTDVGSGDGSHTSGTATLVKSNTGYKAATRTIDWTVKINPHKANLRSGTFLDDLKIGPLCTKGHTCGLQLEGDIHVSMDGASQDNNLVQTSYENQQIKVEVGNVGATTITLTYTTKVCDPCVFANNTAGVEFKNTVSTENMKIGTSDQPRTAAATSTADACATVLTKKAPVYDYERGVMKWTVEVDAAGLPMAGVILTDDLPTGLTYVEDSLGTTPKTSGASASVNGQTLTIDLGTIQGGQAKPVTVTFDTQVNPEILGFGGAQPVEVENTIRMNGSADEVTFAEVSHKVEQTFSNHGLVKSSTVNNADELIRYEVLINPYHLELPLSPSLVDTLDPRLQLDTDTLMFYEAALTGDTGDKGTGQPSYTKQGTGQPLKVTSLDPAANSFTVQLPIPDSGRRGAYVLTYTADIIDYQRGSYSNSVHFEGGSVLLGGGKNNSASTSGGGGGGGGGGVASRKAAIAIVKTDSETGTPIPGAAFALYLWENDGRGLPLAQGTTDTQGKLSFRVNPKKTYLLVETGSAAGYGGAMGWTDLPAGAEEKDGGVLVTAGAGGETLTLKLTNEALTTEIVFRLFNPSGVPMAGREVRLFTENPGENPGAGFKPVQVGVDGTVKFESIRRGAKYYIQRPGGGIMTVEVPAEEGEPPKVISPEGNTEDLTEDYKAEGSEPDQEWTLTVTKVASGGETPLAGAKIGLYANEDCTVQIGEPGVSGADGTVTFPGLMKGQRYWVREVEAPSGYQLDGTAHEAGETDPALTLSNSPAPVHSGGSGRPGKPAKPEEPEIPEEPGTPPDTPVPDVPQQPDTPVEPETPVEPDTPAEPESPAQPDTPAEPEVPAQPSTPPDTPPDLSQQPGAPLWPDGFIWSDFTGGTDGFDWGGFDGPDVLVDEEMVGGVSETAPGTYDGSGGPSAVYDVPQTGDNTGLPAVAALFSGLLLAALTIRRFLVRDPKRRS